MKELLKKKIKLQHDIQVLVDTFVKEVDNEDVIIKIEVETSWFESGTGAKQLYSRDVAVTIEI